MERVDLIPESEAIILSGVSAKTLQRFTDAGYLRIDLQPDGMRRYARGEIHEIFGIHRADITPATPNGAEISEHLRAPTSSASALPGDSDRQATSATQAASTNEPLEASGDCTTALCSELVAAPSPESNVTKSQVTGSDSAEEITRLRNLLALQEKLLDLKDSEVSDLRAQRDWLQRRIEKLEEKGDRDQILLLSETQTIRKLVAMQSEKRSSVRQFLDWIGLSHPKQIPQLSQTSGFQAHGESIEMSRAGND